MSSKTNTNKMQYNRRHGFPLEQGHSLTELSKISNVKPSILKEVYKRGIGAYKTNPASVRPQIKSPQAWASARVIAFLNKKEKGTLNFDKDLLK